MPESFSRPSSQTTQRVAHIVIVGGGFSGTILAVNLLQSAFAPLRITVIDRGDEPGRGIAYSSKTSGLLLNVSARRMSALAVDPDHFVRWLEKRHPEFAPDDFVPRDIYGSYVNELYGSARRNNPAVSIMWIQDEAVSLRTVKGCPELELSKGTLIHADFVVLATGNPPPHLPAVLQDARAQSVISNAWEDDALEGVPADGRVLILGTGLTAIDQIAALEARGFRGSIFLLSRRGRLPATHAPYEAAWPQAWTEILPCRLNDLFAEVRKQIRIAAQRQADWRAVIDSLRSVTPALWSGLSPKDRGRFLRHLQVHWDVARHRMPPQLSALVHRLRDRGRLTIEAGTLHAAQKGEGKVRVQYRKRGHRDICTTHVDRIINCTGTSLQNQGRLVSALVQEGLALPDAIGLGLQVADDGAVMSKGGTYSQQIFAIGPLRKASLWESTAVAEIRVQAADLAATLLQKLDPRPESTTQAP